MYFIEFHDGGYLHGQGAVAVADMPAAAGMAVVARQATPQSASPVAAWCTVTDRLRRLRADLEVRPLNFLESLPRVAQK